MLNVDGFGLPDQLGISSKERKDDAGQQKRFP